MTHGSTAVTLRGILTTPELVSRRPKSWWSWPPLDDLFGRQRVYAHILLTQFGCQVVILIEWQYRFDRLSGDRYGIEIDLCAFATEVARNALELTLEDIAPLSPGSIGQLQLTLERDTNAVGTRVQLLDRAELAQFFEQL